MVRSPGEYDLHSKVSKSRYERTDRLARLSFAGRSAASSEKGSWLCVLINQHRASRRFLSTQYSAMDDSQTPKRPRADTETKHSPPNNRARVYETADLFTLFELSDEHPIVDDSIFDDQLAEYDDSDSGKPSTPPSPDVSDDELVESESQSESGERYSAFHHQKTYATWELMTPLV